MILKTIVQDRRCSRLSLNISFFNPYKVLFGLRMAIPLFKLWLQQVSFKMTPHSDLQGAL